MQLSPMTLELLALYEITNWRFPHSEEEILLWFIDKSSRLFGVTGFSVEAWLTDSPAKQIWSWGELLLAPRHVYAWKDGELEIRLTFTRFRDFEEQDRRLLNVLGCQLGQHLRTLYWYQRLQYLTCHDYLTGLPNRAYLETELERLREALVYPVSFIVCDLDNLKVTNDSRGHSCGDDLLKAAAQILREAVREGDVVARVGGDEFVVVLPRTDRRAVLQVVQRIQRRVWQYNARTPSLPLSLSCGAGTAFSPELLRRGLDEADRAMYSQKVRRKEELMKIGVDPIGDHILRKRPKDGGDKKVDL
ncbi:GGDEF domain-containing protein [Desulfothermobacter acidiphilus]|uniref:GGDEF domain-containing protein n=1 Tax=Desulfothermobacter acidiphilus TaxID=1938353 RepID=UPI003F8A7DB3